jgi:hypothetical protein
MDDANAWTEMGARVIVVLIAALCLYLLLFYRHADFVIAVKDGQVHCSRGVPIVLRHQLTVYLLNDLELNGPMKIMGARQKGRGRLCLWFRGQITPGDRQRVRNFLASRI